MLITDLVRWAERSARYRHTVTSYHRDPRIIGVPLELPAVGQVIERTSNDGQDYGMDYTRPDRVFTLHMAVGDLRIHYDRDRTNPWSGIASTIREGSILDFISVTRPYPSWTGHWIGGLKIYTRQPRDHRAYGATEFEGDLDGPTGQSPAWLEWLPAQAKEDAA